jgi:hypothetical protein
LPTLICKPLVLGLQSPKLKLGQYKKKKKHIESTLCKGKKSKKINLRFILHFENAIRKPLKFPIALSFVGIKNSKASHNFEIRFGWISHIVQIGKSLNHWKNVLKISIYSN